MNSIHDPILLCLHFHCSYWTLWIGQDGTTTLKIWSYKQCVIMIPPFKLHSLVLQNTLPHTQPSDLKYAVIWEKPDCFSFSYEFTSGQTHVISITEGIITFYQGVNPTGLNYSVIIAPKIVPPQHILTGGLSWRWCSRLWLRYSICVVNHWGWWQLDFDWHNWKLMTTDLMQTVHNTSDDLGSATVEDR